MSSQVLPLSVEALIPHGRSIRMVDELLQVGDSESKAVYTVPGDSQFVDTAGRMDEAGYIEMIAQTFAAVHGFHLTPEQRATHRGLLIGVKDLIIHGQASVGDRLTITVQRVVKFGDFGVVDGSVHHQDGRLLAAGQIKVWRPSDESTKDLLS